MINQVFPSAGVYTNEEDKSARATAAATSIVGTVGEAPMGPVFEVTDVFDNENLRTTFGTPDPKKYGFALYCAETALKQTNQLKFVRVVSEDAYTAGAYLTVDDRSAQLPVLKLRVFDDGGNTPQGVYDPLNNLGFPADMPDLDNVLGYFCAANPGAWNNNLSIRIRPSNAKGIDLSREDQYDPTQFIVDVFLNYRSGANPVESFTVSRKYELNGAGEQMYIENVINKRSQYIRFKNNEKCGAVKIKAPVFEFLDGGSDGTRPTDKMISEAYELFIDPESVDVNILMNSGYTTPLVHRQMDYIATTRGDCIAVLDLPDVDHMPNMATDYMRNRLNMSSSYSAMYAPFVKIRDTHNAKDLFVPPSGFVAAAYAYTDSNRAVWFAPAGLNRGQVKVLGIRKKYNQGMRDAMDRIKVNVVRSFTNGRGYVIMGQDTTQTTDSAFSNVNVRRLINFIKKSISTAAIIKNFQPNDSITMLELETIAESFLQPIKAGRGLYAYDAVCDKRNNTPATIANGDIVLDVYADPVIPAKRIHLTSHIMPTGTYFEEN